MPCDGFWCKRVVENRYARDKAFHGDTILPMNALWNSFETLLGLGVEPKDLTFIQISLRGIIVFLVTLVAMRLGHNAPFHARLRSTPSCSSFLPLCFRAPSMVRRLFLPHLAEAWF
jgi:hypothetical protein